MKRLSAMLLCICLLMPLAGCRLFSGGIQEPVMFYYQRTEYLYGQENGVICAEERDSTGHISNMEYLLRLYLTGPLDEELVSPFPAGLQVTGIKTGVGTVRIDLTDELDSLPEAKQTLACACLTLTCLDISGMESVVLVWGDKIITMDKSCLTLFDNSAPQTE